MSSSQSLHKKHSVLGACLVFPVRVAVGLLLSWVIILLLAVFIVILNGAKGLIHLHHVLQYEMNTIYSYHPLGLASSFLKEWIQAITEVTNSDKWFIVPSHYLAFISNQTIATRFYKIATDLMPYAETAILVTQVFLVRVIVIGLFLPLFMILSAVGVIDGGVQRRLRCIQGGRESSMRYQYAKASIMPTFFIGCFIFLVIPIAINPEFILVPSALGLSFVLFVSVHYFKKYL